MRARAVVVPALALFAACAPPRSSAGDPFGGGVAARPRGGGQSYRVRLEVNCDGCRIQYRVGASANVASASQLWHRTLNLAPLQRTALRIQATPSEEGRAVRYVRIFVDGELAAEEGCQDCRDATAETLAGDRSTLTAEAVIGPNAP